MKALPYRHDPDHLPKNIAEIPFFKALWKEEIDLMLSKAELLECASGDVILREGTVDHSLHVLLKGQVHVMKDIHTVASIGHPGDLLGELAIITGGVHSATVIAATNGTYCLRVDSTSLEHLPSERRHAYHAELYLFLSRLMARRLQSTTEKLAAAEKLAADYRKRLDEGMEDA